MCEGRRARRARDIAALPRARDAFTSTSPAQYAITNTHLLAAEVVECRRLLGMSKSARRRRSRPSSRAARRAVVGSRGRAALRGLASSDEAKKLLDAQIAALGEQMSATPRRSPPPLARRRRRCRRSRRRRRRARRRRPRRRSRGGRRRRARTRCARTRTTTTTAGGRRHRLESGILSDPEETAQEERLEPAWRSCGEAREAHDSTLKHTFKLLDCLIGQYKLNRVDAVLAEIADVCHAAKGRGASDWHVKYIQALAFCRWKQHRFKEALDLFYQQQEIVGASSALCENIGHTLSSLGDLPKAEEYFERAIELLKHGSFGNRGGIYMGLGLVRERLGKQKEALPILEQALEHYQKEHTKGHDTVDSSIIAKAHMSIGKVRPAQFSAQFSAQFLRAILTPCPSAFQVHEKLNELPLAARHMAEALRIFRATVGETSPLTAHAMSAYGRVRFAQGPAHNKEAKALLKGALKLESRRTPSTSSQCGKCSTASRTSTWGRRRPTPTPSRARATSTSAPCADLRAVPPADRGGARPADGGAREGRARYAGGLLQDDGRDLLPRAGVRRRRGTARGIAPAARQGRQLRRVVARRWLQLAPLDRPGEQPAPLRGGQRRGRAVGRVILCEIAAAHGEGERARRKYVQVG